MEDAREKIKNDIGLSDEQIKYLEENSAAFDVLYAYHKSKKEKLYSAEVSKEVCLTQSYTSPIMRTLADLSILEALDGAPILYKYYKLKNEKINDLWSHPSFPKYFIEVAFSKRGGARTSHYLHRKLIKDRLIKSLKKSGIITNNDDVLYDVNVSDNLYLDIIKSKSIGFELTYPDKHKILDFLLKRVGYYVHFIANGKKEHEIKKVVFIIIYIGSLNYELGSKFNDYNENLRIMLNKMAPDISVDFRVMSVNKKDVLSKDFIVKLKNKIRYQ